MNAIEIVPYLWKAFQQREKIGFLEADLFAIYEKAGPVIAEVEVRFPEINDLVRSLIVAIFPQYAEQVIGTKATLFTADVPWVQAQLKKKGYYHGTVDGQYGPDTINAVKHFQKDAKISIDGLAGQQTIAELIIRK